MTSALDDEWAQFMTNSSSNSNSNNDDSDEDSDENEDNDEYEYECEYTNKNEGVKVESEIKKIFPNAHAHTSYKSCHKKKDYSKFVPADMAMEYSTDTPVASPIYISTKTNIAYLNTPIDLKDIFWKIPVISYTYPRKGVVKKQIKFNCLHKEELLDIKTKLQDEIYYEEHIITHIDNPTGKIKFKDTRKISIGISKKDLTSYRCKKKSAFYNCFVVIYRMKLGDVFKEFHVKIFNTGKTEMPGIQNESSYQMLLKEVIALLQPHFTFKLEYKSDTAETVLINSNFNCGFYINREALFDLLKMKYNIKAQYDPCTYPGIQCKFYYNPDTIAQFGCQISNDNMSVYKDVKEVSFMIFRTGSVLIVGKCEESVLLVIYEFLKIILNNEYKLICQKCIPGEDSKQLAAAKKLKKTRRKSIMIELDA